MKLQCNVSDSFAEVLDPALQKAALEKHPEKKPPKLGNLIPTALLDYAEAQFGLIVDPALRTEANEILTRKPGPRAKKPIESHDLFDERPGTWISNIAIATGCAMITVGEQSLHLSGCHVPSTAAQRAIEQGWGAIPEAKKTSNDPDHPGLPGMRFVPPGADIVPKDTPAPAPVALADVGAWVSEDSILKRSTLILPDARAVLLADGMRTQPIPSNAFILAQAHPLDLGPIDPDWTEPQKIARQGAIDAARRQAILSSVATAQIEAYELGWTMRREIRNGKPGILLIPPRVKLTYEIAPGRTVPVTQS